MSAYGCLLVALVLYAVPANDGAAATIHESKNGNISRPSLSGEATHGGNAPRTQRALHQDPGSVSATAGVRRRSEARSQIPTDRKLPGGSVTVGGAKIAGDNGSSSINGTGLGRQH